MCYVCNYKTVKIYIFKFTGFFWRPTCFDVESEWYISIQGGRGGRRNCKNIPPSWVNPCMLIYSPKNYIIGNYLMALKSYDSIHKNKRLYEQNTPILITFAQNKTGKMVTRFCPGGDSLLLFLMCIFLNFLQVLCISLLTRESHDRFGLFCSLTRIWQQIKWANPRSPNYIVGQKKRGEWGGGWRVMSFETHRNWGQRRRDSRRAKGCLPCTFEVPMVLLLQATPLTMLLQKNPASPSQSRDHDTNV